MPGRTEHTLTVVLGAGSSYDCAGGETPVRSDPRHRPPLAKDLFSPAFETILARYPKVGARADEFRTKLAKGQSFEDIFRKVLESAYRNGAIWPYQVPLYLREVLWTVSDDYLQGSSKFDTLVRSVLESKFRQVLFVNLNYDLFLERALTDYDGHDFNDLGSYSPASKRWFYVKPHGSVNWGSILENCPTDGAGVLRPSLLKEAPVLSKDLIPVMWSRWSGDFYTPGGNPPGFPYPRIIVPANEPKEFICPENQVQMAKRFMGECDHFLLIGFSGHDSHIVDLLKHIPDASRVVIVSGGDATEVLQRLRSRIETLVSGVKVDLHDEGFGKYIEGLAFESLVEA